MDNNTTPRFHPMVVLGFGTFGISSGSILVRLAQEQEMPSLVIAAWRLALAGSTLLLAGIVYAGRPAKASRFTGG